MKQTNMIGRICKFGEQKFARVVALAAALAGLASLTVASHAPVQDADVWWHLCVGDWIIANHAFPHVGLFSRTAASNPWMAYSWGYEVLLSRAYAWFGLLGLAWYGVVLVFAVAAAYFWMLRRLSNRFWLALFLCVLGSVSFLFNILPRPAFFSMAFFPVVLALMLQAHRENKPCLLYWLPPMFIVWANCHIQFVYGLFAVWMFVAFSFAEPVVSRLPWAAKSNATKLDPGKLIGVGVLCSVATLLGPYSYHVYSTVLSYAQAKYPRAILQDLQPIDFTHPSDYALLLLALWAAAVVIRERDTLTPFRAALLITAAILGFRAVRDCWFLATVAGSLIAEKSAKSIREEQRFRTYDFAVVLAISAVLLFVVARATGFNDRGLDRTISSRFPVNAANFLRRNPIPGPLYNEFGWGGFLIWYLPQYPVAIDPRTDLYGDDVDFMTYKAASGDYAGDKFLSESRVVLLPKETPLAAQLSADPRFRVIYSDRIATISVRN